MNNVDSEYNIINTSYKKILIFHIGCGSGFFSEYNNMIFAIAYCLIHRIKFKLYSKDANFAYDSGWNDFFEPFSEETLDDFHSYLNRRKRFPSICKFIIKKIVYNKAIPTWAFDRFKWYMIKQYIKEPFYKYKYGFNYYTFELWNRFEKFNPYNNQSILDQHVVTDLYSGDLRWLIKTVIDITWKYNPVVETEIKAVLLSLDLPKEYLGMHIRLGDKILEDKLFDYTEYFDLLNEINRPIVCKNIFILTDDYSVIEKVKLKYPEFNIYTLCKPDESGYNNNNFNQQTDIQKRTQLVRLFASVEVLIESKFFVGVLNSNPGIYISLRKIENTYWVDKENQLI